MRLEAQLDVNAVCVGCGAACELPTGVPRVLETEDALYAEVAEPCEACGGTRVRVSVSISDEQPASQHQGRTPRSGQ
jgi:hypothetical protein